MFFLFRPSAVICIACVLTLLLHGNAAAASHVRPAATAAAYTLHDVGMPATTFASTSPVGFNNTGQIFGVGLRKAKADRASYAADTDCVVWTGTHFVDILPSLRLQVCTPWAINSADPVSGAFTVVGSFIDIFHDDTFQLPYTALDAFSASIDAAGSSSFDPYYDHQPAALYGVNAANVAVGFSYNPMNMMDVFVGNVPGKLTWLQPTCASAPAGCLAAEQFLTRPTDLPSKQCAFGGCTINASATVLAYDYATKHFALSTNGIPTSTVELPLTHDLDDVVALNDAGVILYFTRTPPTGSGLYDVASGINVIVPPVAGTSCEYYYPLTLNNRGVAFGYTNSCPQGDFYWTWDAVHGTQDISLAFPPSKYHFEAMGMNDNGQILVKFATSAGEHWGTLDPVTALATRTGSKGSYHGRRPVRSAALSLSPDPQHASVVARASIAAASGPSAAGLRGWGTRNLPGIRSRSRPLAAAAPSYTIDDIGPPPGYALSYPAGFNNTGQIFGDVAQSFSANGARCELWNGKTFTTLPVETVAANSNCSAFSINDADAATGEYEVVGNVDEPFDYDTRAFTVIVGPKGVKRRTLYYAYDASMMIGVSGNGTALAMAELDRDTPLDTRGLHYFTATAGQASLTLLQALPSANGPPVRVLGPTYFGACPFGGCLINNHNIVLGYDNSTFNKVTSEGPEGSTTGHATAAYASVGQPYALTHLPFTDFVSQYGFREASTRDAPLAFNNSDQLVHYDEALHVTSVYDIDTSVLTILPVSPPNCVDPKPHPLSMNNREEVLLVVTNCHRYTGYYTWDPVRGTQYLDPQLPVTDKTVHPLGVNDNGQILVQLTSPAGVVSWGTLNPVATAVRR